MSATYKIGEAASLLNLKTYVLRFWETEFPQIAPLRTEKGQRLYTEENLALLSRIRFLLHERGLTIEGARKVLAEEAGRGVSYVRGHPSIESWQGLPEDSGEHGEFGDADAACSEDVAGDFSESHGGAKSAGTVADRFADPYRNSLFDLTKVRMAEPLTLPPDPAGSGGRLPLPGIAGNGSTQSSEQAGSSSRGQLLQGIVAELESVAAILNGTLPGKTI